MRVMVTGGAGYIGSVVVEQLVGAGHTVGVLDNLWRGHRRAIEPEADFFAVDLRDRSALIDAVRTFHPEVMMHFAAASIVPESMRDPQLYFDNNVAGTANLLAACKTADVNRLVVSSTAAVYGLPDQVPITEEAAMRPINVYGQSKFMIEQMLAARQLADGLRYVSFRYFNVAGATARHGEDHHPETHVIPVALRTALGRQSAFSIFGDDYPTPDGTAVRDYVHVADLARAHIAAIDVLAESSLGPVNLGSRSGFSVREIVAAVERVTGTSLPTEIGPRRAGDPPVLVADPTLARSTLGWEPRLGSLEEMISSAWRWMQQHPAGYPD